MDFSQTSFADKKYIPFSWVWGLKCSPSVIFFATLSILTHDQFPGMSRAIDSFAEFHWVCFFRHSSVSFPSNAHCKTACRYTFSCCWAARRVSTPLSSSLNSSSSLATMRCCSARGGSGNLRVHKKSLVIALKVVPVPALDNSFCTLRKMNKTNLLEIPPDGFIAERPRPIQAVWFSKFVGPTGALTDNKTSPISPILLGLLQYLTGVGYSSPNSVFP